MRTQAQWIKDSIANTRLASEVCSGIEVRSITHNNSSSNNTHHFKAHIYVDGTKVMRVENDGRGDNNYYTPPKEEGRKLYRKASIEMLTEAKVYSMQQTNVRLNSRLPMQRELSKKSASTLITY